MKCNYCNGNFPAIIIYIHMCNIVTDGINETHPNETRMEKPVSRPAPDLRRLSALISGNFGHAQ